MVQRILTDAVLRRRAKARRTYAQRCIRGAWLIVFSVIAVIAMKNRHDEIDQIPLYISAAMALLTAIGVTLIYRVAR